MNIGPEANDIAMDVASILMRFLSEVCPGWDCGYFRFAFAEGSYTATVSCVLGQRVQILGSLDHASHYDLLENRAASLFGALELGRGVALFIVKSSRECEIKFDLEDLTQWQISKLDGGTGIPEGL